MFAFIHLGTDTLSLYQQSLSTSHLQFSNLLSLSLSIITRQTHGRREQTTIWE